MSHHYDNRIQSTVAIQHHVNPHVLLPPPPPYLCTYAQQLHNIAVRTQTLQLTHSGVELGRVFGRTIVNLAYSHLHHHHHHPYR